MFIIEISNVHIFFVSLFSMLQKIKENVAHYNEFYTAIKQDATEIREKLLSNKYEFFEEPIQIKKIEKFDGNISIGASDSGFFSDALTSLDFVYIKSAGSYFNYSSGKLTEYKRLPRNPIKELLFSENILQKDEIHKFVSIKRIKEELKILKTIANEKNPEFLLIDGPVLPQPVDRPLNNSKLYHDYKNMVALFVELYDLCKKQNNILVGCVEDSRANTFMDLIKNKNTRINDTILTNLILEKSESLAFFKIFSTESNIINQDLEEFGKFNFYSTYLKLNDDYPLRIETVSKEFKKVRDTIGFLASNFRDYCFPTPLIDADKQAKLNKNEIETIRTLIEREFAKYKIKKMRRERRI